MKKVIKQVKSSDLTGLEQTSMSRSMLRCCLFCLPDNCVMRQFLYCAQAVKRDTWGKGVKVNERGEGT